jgi:predicted AlkP superfamily pyrophosphatase or phosphodiesterase
MRRLLLISTCWLVLPGLAFAAGPTPKVLLIGIDGTRWDAVEQAHTPRLDGLVRNGTLALGTDILAPRETPGDTVSGPGWSNLLCGVWPDKHGVVDNSFKHANYAQFPHIFARIKAVRPQAVTASFANWGPITEQILSAADVARNYAATGLDQYVATDERSASDCADYLRTGQPDVVMLYLGQIDETGHRYGFHPKVPQYVQAIERVDGLLGRVLDALADRPSVDTEDWLVLVATDHGGLGLGHGGGRSQPEIRRTFLIVSGPSARRGVIETPTYQVDVAATLLAHLRITPDPAWKLDGQPVGLASVATVR